MATEIMKRNGASVEAGIAQRESFGTQELERSPETASTAVAAREKAATEARYILAMRKRRDWEDVRVRLLGECRRPGFAKTAWYKIPNRGEGWTIRFAEAALRCMTNVYPEVCTVYDDSERTIFRVCVTDLESNLTYASEVTVRKTVERSKVNPGDVVIGERLNSFGKKVYIREATDDEMLVKQNALISKAIRTNALRLLPGDISDDCKSAIFAAMHADVGADPDAAKRQLIDAFNELGILPSELQEYLGHNLERIQPGEIIELRSVYRAIKDEGVTWASVMEAKAPSGTQAEADRVAADKIAKLKAQAAAKQNTTPTTVATATESGETDARQSAGTASEIPPASTHGTKVFEDFPDPFTFAEGDSISVKGNIYTPNADATGWNEVKPAKAQSGYSFGKGRK